MRYPASRVSFDLSRKIEGDSARRVIVRRNYLTVATVRCEKKHIFYTFAGIRSAISVTRYNHILGYSLNLLFFPVLVLLVNVGILSELELVVFSFFN